MKLSDFMDLSHLQKIQDTFSQATGLAAIAVDMDGSYMTKGSGFTDFCNKQTQGLSGRIEALSEMYGCRTGHLRVPCRAYGIFH